MNNSLKTKLFEAIKGVYPKEFTLEMVNALAYDNGYKVSNAERRLRELCEPNDAGYAPVIAVRNDKKIIVGYLYQEMPKFEIKFKPRQEPMFDYQGTFLRQ